MHFTTPTFAYFFVGALTLSWATRRNLVWHKLALLSASYLFYAGLNPALAGLLLGVSLLNWGSGELLVRERRLPVRRGLLWLTVAVNVALLGSFKYLGFLRELASSVAAALALEVHLPIIQLLFPVGISFYIFQALSYLFELNKGDPRDRASLLDFLLFIAFFPKLLAGPLCLPKELLPQLRRGPALPDVSQAAVLIASGLVKKVVLATIIGSRLVDRAFISPENYSSAELLLAAYGYSIQLYCDFSGYTDIARGVALLLGYKLPENFARPYAATNIGDFWRRWHQTFSRWLREYLYFPLGGSRGTLARTCVNLMVTFLICGLWHGASWGFVIWGGLHGLALCGHKLLRDLRRARGLMPDKDPLWWMGLGWFATFHFCVLARIFFHAGDLDTALSYFARLAGGTGAAIRFEPVVLAACALGFALNFVGAPLREGVVRLHRTLPWFARPVVWAALGLILLAAMPQETSPFIYFSY